MQRIEELDEARKGLEEVVGGLNEGRNVFRCDEDVLVVVDELELVRGEWINAYIWENSVHPLHHLSENVFCALVIVECARRFHKSVCKRLEETGLDVTEPSPECSVSERDVE